VYSGEFSSQPVTLATLYCRGGQTFLAVGLTYYKDSSAAGPKKTQKKILRLGEIFPNLGVLL
jgi:hypothetical protein